MVNLNLYDEATRLLSFSHPHCATESKRKFKLAQTGCYYSLNHTITCVMCKLVGDRYSMYRHSIWSACTLKPENIPLDDEVRRRLAATQGVIFIGANNTAVAAQAAAIDVAAPAVMPPPPAQRSILPNIYAATQAIVASRNGYIIPKILVQDHVFLPTLYTVKLKYGSRIIITCVRPGMQVILENGITLTNYDPPDSDEGCYVETVEQL